MKSWILMIAILAMMWLTGCSSVEAQPTEPEKELVFLYNGMEIAMGVEAAPVLEVLGEPKSYTETPSCLFEGVDKTYYYDGFYLTTSPSPEGDRIRKLWFADDSVQTPEGIAIGDEAAEVVEAYDVETCGDVYFYDRGDTCLNIITRKGIVTSVQYVSEHSC